MAGQADRLGISFPVYILNSVREEILQQFCCLPSVHKQLHAVFQFHIQRRLMRQKGFFF